MTQSTFLKASFIVLFVFICTGAVLLPGNASIKEFFTARKAKDVVADYTDNTILKTLGLFVDDVNRLNLAVNSLKADQTEKNLTKAAAAWHNAHSRWKSASVFLYGPAAQYDFHKQIATWPFDKILVDHALKEISEGKLTVDSGYLRNKLTSSMRGFYTLKYLLFRDRQQRKAKDIKKAEMIYLVAATRAMLEESIDFEASWIGTENLSAARVNILKKAGIKNRPSYADEFRNPGKAGSRYASLSVVLQEIMQESTGVLEDMAPVILELLDTTDSENTDYWDSQDPYSDLQQQLISVENAYLGGIKGYRGSSVSELVADKNNVLDRYIKIAFAHTSHGITAIKDSSGQSLEKRMLAVKVAEAERQKLVARIITAMPLVTLDPAVRPWAAYGQ